MHYTVHKITPLDPTLSHMSPFPISTLYFSKTGVAQSV
jgi:hypothetical protein